MNTKRKRSISRKGIIFTAIAVLLTILLTALYGSMVISYAPYSNKASATRIRVMDNYVQNFERYVEASLKISTYSTLNSLYNDSTQRGRFYIDGQDFRKKFESCMTCGFLDSCIGKTLKCPLLAGKDLNSMIKNITELSRANLNIITEYDIRYVSITQNYPFDVDVEIGLIYSVYDIQRGNYAVWQRNKTFSQTVSIIGLRDPMIAVNTGNAFTRKILWSSICRYNESCWNQSAATHLYNTGEYRYYGNGTSYLSRFWNGSSEKSACCGIESFLNTSIASGLNSYIDHHYWSGTFRCIPSGTSVAIIEVNSTAPSFRLEEGSAVRYRLASSGFQICP